MSNGKARLRKTEVDLLKEISKQNKIQFARERALVSGIGSPGSQVAGGSRGRGGSTNQQEQGFLKTSGDTMIGAFATHPVDVSVSNGEIDISRGTVDFASNIIVLGQGGAADDVDTITGAAFAGQWLLLQAVATTPITLKHLTDNIWIPGGSDYTVAGNENVLLKFDSINNWWSLVSNFGVGANTTLSNLDSPTAINQSLLFGTTGLDIGDATNPVDDIFVNQVRLQTGAIVINKPMITSTNGTKVDINFPTGSQLAISENGTSKWTVTGTNLTGANIILTNTLNINDSSIDPAANGQLSRNGTELKVYSSGRVRSFSDMMENPAFETLNMGANTIDNTNDILPALDSTYFVGNSSTKYAGVFADFIGISGSGTRTTYASDITEVIGSNTFNVLGSAFRLQVSNSSVSVNAPLVVQSGNDIDFVNNNVKRFVVETFSDGTRPSAGNQGRVIFNSSDGQLNIDDGSNWTLPDGTAT